MKYKKIEDINWNREFPAVPGCVHNAIESANREILAKKPKKKRGFPRKRILLLAAVITLLSGMTVFASVSLWQQRMEDMNREEIKNYFISIVSGKAPSFRYNRVMTEKETLLFEEMKYLYENEGVFPKGVLTMLASADEYKGRGIGYDKASGTFFLPEKGLNEEQVLQIIDFYHKAEYAVSSINEMMEEQEITELSGKEEKENSSVTESYDKEYDAAANMKYQDYQSVNKEVSCYEIPLEAEELLIALAAGKEYLYLGFQTEIKRMALGSDMLEDFYELQENETVFAMGSDEEDNVYLLLRKYDVAADAYINQLLRIDVEGRITAEYDLESAICKEDKTAKDVLVDKMLVDETGKLYLKCRTCPEITLFIFDSDGNYLDKIVDGQYGTHEANGMCFGEDGFLYMLADKQIVKIDTASKKVILSYDFWTDEMTAMVDAIYPVNKNDFHILSYDGLFQYSVKENYVKRILAPFETELFSEGMRYAPISGGEWVVVYMTDYENFRYKIMYLLVNEKESSV